jgi:hypothetical protein
MAGYSASRLGQRYAASLNPTKAKTEFLRSDSLLSKAIKLKNVKTTNQKTISMAFRTYVLNAEARQDLEIAVRKEKACRRLTQWLAWAPNDPYAKHEALKRLRQCPGILDVIDPGLREAAR